MKSVRGGRGLGDAIYVHGVLRHLLAHHDRLTVCTDYPDVYQLLCERVRCEPFRRRPVDIIAHYAGNRAIPGTSQFDDCCISAGLPSGLEFKVDWRLRNTELVVRLNALARGRPIIVVQMPRAPFARTDGYGIEFLPDVDTIQRAIDAIGGRAFLVQIGMGRAERFDGKRMVPFEGYRGIDLDLSNKTSVADVMDVGFAAAGFLGQCSFIIPLAEGFAKPALIVWSRRGQKSPHEVIRQMTPQKILHRATSRWVIDNCGESELRASIDALCDESGRARAA